MKYVANIKGKVKAIDYKRTTTYVLSIIRAISCFNKHNYFILYGMFSFKNSSIILNKPYQSCINTFMWVL